MNIRENPWIVINNLIIKLIIAFLTAIFLFLQLSTNVNAQVEPVQLKAKIFIYNNNGVNYLGDSNHLIEPYTPEQIQALKINIQKLIERSNERFLNLGLNLQITADFNEIDDTYYNDKPGGCTHLFAKFGKLQNDTDDGDLAYYPPITDEDFVICVGQQFSNGTTTVTKFESHRIRTNDLDLNNDAVFPNVANNYNDLNIIHLTAAYDDAYDAYLHQQQLASIGAAYMEDQNLNGYDEAGNREIMHYTFIHEIAHFFGTEDLYNVEATGTFPSVYDYPIGVNAPGVNIEEPELMNKEWIGNLDIPKINLTYKELINTQIEFMRNSQGPGTSLGSAGSKINHTLTKSEITNLTGRRIQVSGVVGEGSTVINSCRFIPQYPASNNLELPIVNGGFELNAFSQEAIASEGINTASFPGYIDSLFRSTAVYVTCNVNGSNYKFSLMSLSQMQAFVEYYKKSSGGTSLFDEQISSGTSLADAYNAKLTTKVQCPAIPSAGSDNKGIWCGFGGLSAQDIVVYEDTRDTQVIFNEKGSSTFLRAVANNDVNRLSNHLVDKTNCSTQVSVTAVGSYGHKYLTNRSCEASNFYAGMGKIDSDGTTDAAEEAWIKSLINTINNVPDGSNNTLTAWRGGVEKDIIFVTDSKPVQPDQGTYVADLVNIAKANGIRLSILYLGTDSSAANLLQGITSQTGGKFIQETEAKNGASSLSDLARYVKKGHYTKFTSQLTSGNPGTIPQTIQYTATAVGGYSPDSWQWDLDNNGTFESTGPVVTKTYNVVGKYDVKLKDIKSNVEDTKVIPTYVDAITGSSSNFNCNNIPTNVSGDNDMPVSDCQILVDLYNGLNGYNWDNRTGWMSAANPCDWSGVTCLSGVRTLSLSVKSGVLPSSIGNFTNALIYLNICGGSMSGNIPKSLGNLRARQITICTSHLSGSIPKEIANNPNLEILSLTGNKLSGSIPVELATHSKLNNINLSSNLLSGSIPSQFGNMATLGQLNLAVNQLTGSIPSTFGNNNMVSLRVENNLLTGEIPANVANLDDTMSLVSYGGFGFSENMLYAGSNTSLNNFLVKYGGAGWTQYQIYNPPTNLVATATSKTTINLSWTPPNYMGGMLTDIYYEIYMSTSASGPFVYKGKTTKNGTNASYSVDGLTGSTTYYFKVRSRIDLTGSRVGSRMSQFSTQANATTQNLQPSISADFVTSTTSGYAPLTVSFYDFSTAIDTSINTRLWDFNGDTVVDSTAINGTYTFTTPGTYTVRLTVGNGTIGDTEERIGYIQVNAAPSVTAGFSGTPVSGYAPLNVAFADSSTASNTTITSRSWDFNNDGVVDSTAQNPNYTYTTPGTYTVKLTVSNGSISDDEVKTSYITVNNPLFACSQVEYTSIDSYVRGGTYASNNYGTAVSMYTKDGGPSYDRQSFMRFDLTGTDYTTITSAKLRLHVDDIEMASSTQAAVNFYDVTDNTWTESGITWNNKPSFGSSVVTWNVVDSQEKTWLDIDVTSYVQAQLNGDRIINLGTWDTNAANEEIEFDTRDSINKPFLEITGVSGDCTAPLAEGTYELDRQVSTAHDDGGEDLEYTSGGDMMRTRVDLFLTRAWGTDDFETAVRFQNITIPQGATIKSAYIEVVSHKLHGSVVNMNIYGHDIDNAPKLEYIVDDITSRAKTTAFYNWTNLGVWNQNSAYRTGDLKAVVQEIVDRGGWVSGNAMMFIINGTGDRSIYSYDGSTTYAPKLHIEYDL